MNRIKPLVSRLRGADRLVVALLVTGLILTSVGIAYAAVGDTNWTNTNGELNGDLVFALAHDEESGTVVAGEGGLRDGTDEFLIGFDADTGAEVWENTGDEFNYDDATVHDGVAYVTAYRNQSTGDPMTAAAAYDAASGQFLWQQKGIAGNSLFSETSVAYDDTRNEVFVASGSWVHKLDASDGSVLFSTRPGTSPTDGHIVDIAYHSGRDEFAFADRDTGNVTVVDASDTSNRREINLSSAEQVAFDESRNILIVGEVATTPPEVRAYDLTDLSQEWVADTGGNAIADITVNEGLEQVHVGLGVSSSVDQLNTFYAANGSTAWTYELPTNAEDIQSVAHRSDPDTVFVGDDEGNVTSVEVGEVSYEVSGVVRDGDGNGIENAIIYVNGTATAASNVDGNYSLSTTPGTYNLTAARDGYTTQEKVVSVSSDTTVNFTLQSDPGYVDLRIRSYMDHGDTQPYQVVYQNQSDGSLENITADASVSSSNTNLVAVSQGSTQLSATPNSSLSGVVDITASYTDFNGTTFTDTEQVTVVAEENVSDSDLVGYLNGTVTNGDTGNPIEGAVITVDEVLYNRTDSNGEYNIILANGTYIVGADKQGFAQGNALVRMENGTNQTQDFQLNPRGVGGPGDDPFAVTFDFRVDNYMEHGTSQRYEAIYDNGTMGRQNVTDDISVTSDNTSVVEVFQSNNTLVATDDVSVAQRVNVTAEYQAPDGQIYEETQRVTVANETVGNLPILPPGQRFTASLQDPNLQVILVATMVGVAASIIATAFAGIAAIAAIVMMGWAMGMVVDGLAIVTILMCAFVGMNIAGQIDYNVPRP